MKISDRLNEFFVLTLSGSVYHVTGGEDYKQLTVTKIVSRGKSEVELGDKLDAGNLLGITRESSLIAYNYGERLPVEKINPMFHLSKTSPIVALFKDRSEALESQWVDKDKLEMWDDKWYPQTKVTLDDIGNCHPVFVISPDVPR